jgi:hypothetical protein
MFKKKETPAPRVDVLSVKDADLPFDQTVYIDFDGTGTDEPRLYSAQSARAFTVRVDGREFVHKTERPDGAWVYWPC